MAVQCHQHDAPRTAKKHHGAAAPGILHESCAAQPELRDEQVQQTDEWNIQTHTADDVRPHLAAADCVVLPSYREGTPRTLLEAAAMAKPIIATDVPGCREVVEHGRNGLLCKVRDADDLARRMIEMIDMCPAERRSMGAAGRAKMEAEFDERFVVAAYLDALQRIA